MTRDNIFESVVANALDFFDRSTQEFKDHPKYSLIHFCAAVELFLKARLMLEHWSLVFDKPESADWVKFCDGAFTSVGLQGAQKRLAVIVREPLSPSEYDSFVRLVVHRNRLVHFHLSDQGAEEKLAEQVAEQQLSAWCYLHRLLTGRWRGHFSTLGPKLTAMEESMHQRREYLQAKYDVIKEEIDAEERAGRQFEACPACGFRSAGLDQETGALHRLYCRVCHWYSHELEIECPECAETVVFHGEGHGSCDKCGMSFDPKRLVDIYTDEGAEYLSQKDGDDSLINSNCFECGSQGTVVPFHEKYLCMNCFWLSEDRWNCRRCGALINVESEARAADGCADCSYSLNAWGDHK